MNMDKVMSLNLNEVCAVMKLMELAKEAKEVAELINQTYKKYEAEESEVIVWNEKSDYEYLSDALVWHGWYSHEIVSVTCTPDVIFELFKAEYFAENRVVDEYYKNQAQICKRFRIFVNRVKEKVN